MFLIYYLGICDFLHSIQIVIIITIVITETINTAPIEPTIYHELILDEPPVIIGFIDGLIPLVPI